MPAKVLLDASFVVVTQPSIQPGDELVNGYTCPVSGVEELVLESGRKNLLPVSLENQTLSSDSNSCIFSRVFGEIFVNLSLETGKC